MAGGWNDKESIINQLMLAKQNDWIKKSINEINCLNRVQKDIIRVLYKGGVFSNLNCVNMSELAAIMGCTKMAVSMNVQKLVDLKIIRLAPYKRGSSRRMWLNTKDYPAWVNAVLVRLGQKTI